MKVGCEALLMPDLRIPDGINPRAVGGWSEAIPLGAPADNGRVDLSTQVLSSGEEVLWSDFAYTCMMIECLRLHDSWKGYKFIRIADSVCWCARNKRDGVWAFGKGGASGAPPSLIILFPLTLKYDLRWNSEFPANTINSNFLNFWWKQSSN